MQLGWIDFSEKEREKVLDVVNLLTEEGAVDELGIGIIRDSFANLFFRVRQLSKPGPNIF